MDNLHSRIEAITRLNDNLLVLFRDVGQLRHLVRIAERSAMQRRPAATYPPGCSTSAVAAT